MAIPRTSFGDISDDEDMHDPNRFGQPEDSMYAGPNPEIRAMRRKAIAAELGVDPTASDATPQAPDMLRRPTIDMGGIFGPSSGAQQGPFGSAEVSIDGTRNTRNIDPDAYRRISASVLADPRFQPHQDTAEFNGQKYSWAPRINVSSPSANAINASQIRQIEADRILGQHRADQEAELNKIKATGEQQANLARIPGAQRIEEEKLKRGYQQEDYARDNPADILLGKQNVTLAQQRRQLAEEEYALAHGGRTQAQELAAGEGAVTTLAPELLKTPEGRVALPALFNGRPGYNTPGAQGALSAISKPRPEESYAKVTKAIAEPDIAPMVAALDKHLADHSTTYTDQDMQTTQDLISNITQQAQMKGLSPAETAQLTLLLQNHEKQATALNHPHPDTLSRIYGGLRKTANFGTLGLASLLPAPPTR